MKHHTQLECVGGPHDGERWIIPLGLERVCFPEIVTCPVEPGPDDDIAVVGVVMRLHVYDVSGPNLRYRGEA